MKAIFLDVDGVLTHELCINGVEKDLDEEKVLLLKKIIEETNAKIVLISSWRKFVDKPQKNNPYYILEKMLNRNNIEIYDRTSVMKSIKKVNDCKVSTVEYKSKRGNEILKWVEENKPESYVIIDDSEKNYYELGLEDHFIKTSYCDEGLKEEHVIKAIEILNKTRKKRY